MGGDGEDEPDWIRSFQAPRGELVTLCSDSESPPETSPSKTYMSKEESRNTGKEEAYSVAVHTSHDSPELKNKISKSVHKGTSEELTEDVMDEEDRMAEEDTEGKDIVLQTVPLIIPEKVQRSKAIVECGGDSIDLSGDIGAVGRIIISDGPTGCNDLLLDLKGTIYKTTIVPSRTFCIINMGQSEAKVEAIMNDFIQLEPQSNLYETETMVEGTLEGFTFDSDEEADNIPHVSSQKTDQNNEADDQPKPKNKRKAEKAVVGTKKAKVTVRPPKRGARRTTAAKKERSLKKK